VRVVVVVGDGGSGAQRVHWRGGVTRSGLHRPPAAPYAPALPPCAEGGAPEELPVPGGGGHRLPRPCLLQPQPGGAPAPARIPRQVEPRDNNACYVIE
jgi:hypothetical protein